MPNLSNWSNSLSLSSVEEKYKHSYPRILLIIFTLITFILSVILNVLNLTGTSFFGNKIFNAELNKTLSTNDLETDMKPSISITYLWILILFWQCLWLIYGVTTIFRKSSSDYFYKYPPVMHWLVYLNFAITNILHVVCLFFLDHRFFMLASCYAILMVLGLYIATFTSLFKLSDYQREMYYTEKTTDVWYIRILVQNGMIMYASWSFVLFLYALDLGLVFEKFVPSETSHLIIISILCVAIFFQFLIENYLAYNHFKFLVTAWIVYAIYIVDTMIHHLSLEKQHTTESNKFNINSVMHICLLCLYVFLLAGKIFKFVWHEICNHNKIKLNF
jgi:hypothetical protein